MPAPNSRDTHSMATSPLPTLQLLVLTLLLFHSDSTQTQPFCSRRLRPQPPDNPKPRAEAAPRRVAPTFTTAPDPPVCLQSRLLLHLALLKRRSR